MTRQSVQIERKPIRVLHHHGIHCGGWYAFAPTEHAPSNIRLKDSERLLYCPYCGQWTIFKRRIDDMDNYRCTGWCGWANTNEYYVKKFNRLWKVDIKKTPNALAKRGVDMSPREIKKPKKRK